ncbi:hypothetical protein EJB05_16846 [Eragrostis curvula]|uniref:Maternal effect embryo arrest 22 n=1 Tax=Eragrostis curvula TaxID=38414 RepID=A0A5J9VHB4_9POAL|nr:hypothetical protein EJB05_16846 [Eragrostis curvula]
MAAAPPEPDSSREPPTAAGAGGPNPCCAKLWKKYQKLEKGRALLREAVSLLQNGNDKLQKENAELSKVCKEERLRGDSAEAARETESDARERLEKEIIELKSQNSALQQTQNVCSNDNELIRISELEEENRKLKQVLGEERKKITSEKKKVDEEKSKALEMQKILRSETQKSEEYRRVADTERKVAGDWRVSCERLRSEVNEVRAQLTAQIQKTEEALKSVEAEKLKLSREKKRADSEKSLAEKNKTLFEAERKKVTQEKKRADNLLAKLEEQKKLNEDLRTSIQVERKNAVEEKKRADNLFRELEEERKRSECLLRKPNELGNVRDVVSSGKCGRLLGDRASESANVKLLKEKLKLKKGQLKHARNVAKLDKAKNALIRREFQRIRQDWMQLLSRFNMLDDHLAGGIEGIHALTELKKHPEIHGLEQRLLPNDPVAAPYIGLQAGMVPFGSSIPREYTSYQLPRESCTRPVSGTSSELGPPLGSSLRTKSKCHPRSSFPTSISDEKFMGSQGKDNLLVSSSTDIRGKHNSIPKRPLKDRFDTMRQEDRVLSLEALKSLSGGTEVTDRTLGGARKRKRTKQSLESNACLSSKHDVLHSKSKAHAVTLNDILAYKDDRSGLQHGNNIMPCVTEGDMENCKRKYLSIADRSAPPAEGNACSGSRMSSLLSFEEKMSGNCLKLLSLDNDADEEKYRLAMERPLSPNLPSIRPRRTKARAPEEPHSFDGDAVNDCAASGSNAIGINMSTKILEAKRHTIQKLTQNDIQLGTSSKIMEWDNGFKLLPATDKSDAAVNISCNAELVGVPTNASSSRVSMEDNVRNNVASSVVEAANISTSVLPQNSCSDNPNSSLHSWHLCKEVPEKTSSHQICDRSSDPGLHFGTSKAKGSKPGLDSNSILGHHCESLKAPMHLVGFMGMKRSSIENIVRYWEKLISEAGKVSMEASIDGPSLKRVSTEPLLHIDEKVSLIFSLMLRDIGFTAEPFANGHYSSPALSLNANSYVEVRWDFLQNDQLNVLISLIEDFLRNKEVMECRNLGQKVSDSRKYHNQDDRTDILLCTKPATMNQFISACILLGSICAKADRADIILEVSYKVVQMGKSNLSWTLLALHVFGSVCGDKFFIPKSGSFLVTAIRLIVLLLERKDTSVCLVSSYIQTNMPRLPSCAQCPFDVDTVSVDVFISSLLDELALCSLLWNNRASSDETIAMCSTHLGSCGLEINCGESCNIFKQGKLAEDSHSCPGRIDLCYFTELISLLELFGIYMSCDWTYNNVVIRLLKILESCTCEEYAAALLVLVGQLGRFFIDDVGYEQRAVSELRDKLSLLMGTSFMKSVSVTVQFSAIGALLIFLPLPFADVVATRSRPLSGPFVLQARQISDWFLQLSKEHQSLACSFFS